MTSIHLIAYHKFVNFFLLLYVTGDVAPHDSHARQARQFHQLEN